MSESQLEITELRDNQFKLIGSLVFDTVPSAWSQRLMFIQSDACQIDLSQIERIDSAGAVFLLSLIKQAEAKHVAVQFVNMPQQCLAILQLSDLDPLFKPHIATESS